MKSNIKYISNIYITNRLVPRHPTTHNSKTPVKSQKIYHAHSQSNLQNDQQNQIRVHRVHSTKEKSDYHLQHQDILQQKTLLQYEGHIIEKYRNSSQTPHRKLKDPRYSYDLKAGAQANKFVQNRILKETHINYTNQKGTQTKKMVSQYKVGAFTHCPQEINEVVKRKQRYGQLKKRYEYRTLMKDWGKRSHQQEQGSHTNMEQMKDRGKRSHQQEQGSHTNMEQMKDKTEATEKQTQQYLYLTIKKLELKVQQLEDQLLEKQKQDYKYKQEKQKIDDLLEHNQKQLHRLTQTLNLKTLQLQTYKLQAYSYQQDLAAKDELIKQLSNHLANYQHRYDCLSGNYKQLLEIFGLGNQQTQEDEHPVLIQTIKDMIDSYCELAENGDYVKKDSEYMNEQELMKDINDWKGQNSEYEQRISELEEANRELSNVIENQIEKNYQLQDVLKAVSESLMRQKVSSLNTRYRLCTEVDD